MALSSVCCVCVSGRRRPGQGGTEGGPDGGQTRPISRIARILGSSLFLGGLGGKAVGSAA